MKIRNIVLLISAIALISFSACEKLGFGKKSFTITIDGTEIEFPADSIWIKPVPLVGGQMFEAINEEYWVQVVNNGSDFVEQTYDFSGFIPNGIFYIVSTNSYENFSEGTFIIEKINDDGEFSGTLEFKTANTTATKGKFKKVGVKN